MRYPRWLFRKTLADKLMLDFMRGKAFTKGAGDLRARTNAVVISTGEYYLLQRHSGVIWLEVDHAAATSARPLVEKYRTRAIALADRYRLPIIPVGSTALGRAKRGADDIRLIHRDGLESVFAMDGRYYLSGWDDQEKPPLYFLCRLPRPVETVAEAREALKPPSVIAAEAAGIEVRRQGDLFTIKTPLTTEDIRNMGGKIFPHPVVQEVVLLYGTNHTAARVAVLPDGRMLASGTMTHNPRLRGESRGPDHHPLPLGGAWWWVARNTVPLSTPSRGRERGPERAISPAGLPWDTIARWTLTTGGWRWP